MVKKTICCILIFAMISMLFSPGSQSVIAVGDGEHRFEAVNITDRTATLEWDPIDEAISYSLYLNGSKLFEYTADKFSFDVKNMYPDEEQVATLYYKNAEDIAFNLTHTFTTEPENLKPPANLRISNITTNSADIDWDHYPYSFEYEVVINGEYEGRVSDGLSSYSFSNLEPHTPYKVEVYALYSGSQSSIASEIDFTTEGSWPDAEEVNFKAEAITTTSATLLWNEVTGATAYHLTDGKGFEQSVIAATYELTGLSPNTSYTYTLIASIATQSSDAYTYTFTTESAPPAAATSLMATAGDAQVSLVWNAVTGEGNTYNVKRSTTSGGPYTKIVSDLIAANYVDATAANGTTYYYVVTVVSTDELESTPSNEATARPVAVVIPPNTNDDIDVPQNNDNSSSNNNGQITLKVTFITEQTADGKTVTKGSVDPADMQKALEDMKSSSGDPQLIVEIPGDADVTNLQLSGSMLSSIKELFPTSAAITVKSDNLGSYSLPVSAVDVEAVAARLGSEVKDINITISMEKVAGATADSINSDLSSIGAVKASNPVEYKVIAEANGKSTNLNQFGSYVNRTVPIVKKPIINSTGVVYNPNLGTFSFVPATIKEGTATFKRPGNSIYLIIEISKTFEDLKGHWAKADVELLASKLIVKGTTPDRFEPNALITRAEFTSLLVTSMGLYEHDSSTFSDVKSTDWFAGAVNEAAKAGFVEGYKDGTFMPNAKITREQMVVMIMKAMRFARYEATPDTQKLAKFTDSNLVSSWAKDEFAQSVSAGVITGRTSSSLAPAEHASRAEAVVMLKRMLYALEFIN